jgi:toxin ParE1/3/4
MKLRWATAAADDLQAINNYLQMHHPTLAASTTRTVYNAIKRLKSHPNRGRPGRRADTRELVLAPLPYLVIYRVESEHIEVLRILHAAQDWR